MKTLLIGFLLWANPQDHPGPDDVKSAQSIIDAYYDVISGPIGEKRDFDRFRSLFHPEARFVYSYWNADHSQASTMVMNTEEFIGKLGYLDAKGFYEHEITNVTHTFGSVTQVFSSYRFTTEDKSIPDGAGITSYELFYDGNRYWILSMFWQAENAVDKIPAKFLK